ncbi:uncharacterized protein LOC118405311 isoform X2 [Branchiostoma floridae]|uniref:Uncharacterized protein LOC118405311 isoform X2 n=1 Tax=Branchiostoma floridae TaxID=7739 RepID=A0A9J7HJG8_BRAFL|nr:uncharacterized protein LOC118405311 isoform X2 [Branchiostoma floridae]
MDGKERLRMEEGEAEDESESEEEDLDGKEQRRPSTDDMADRKSGVTGYQEDLGESIKKDSSVPLEIQLRGPGMQQLYSQACRQGALPLHNTRGLVVGQYRSGKTCVVRRLTGEKAVEDEPITDGIEISPSVMTTTWRKAKEEPDEFKETMAERLTKLQKWNIAKFQTSLRSQQAVKSHGDKTNLTGIQNNFFTNQ